MLGPFISLQMTQFHSFLYCCSSVTQLCPALCDPMDCSTPGFPVLHQLLELAQTHVHWVDVIQPSHALLSPSPPAFILYQHQSLFQWVGSFHQVARNIRLQLQHQSFQWIFRFDFLKNWLVWSPCCAGVFFRLQFEGFHSLATWGFRSFGIFIVQFSHPYMTTGKSIVLMLWTFVSKVMSLLFNMLSRIVIALLPRSRRL